MIAAEGDMRRIRREFWHDDVSGDIWAVELEDGGVTACFGPLDRSEVDVDLLDGYPYAPERGGWLERHRERFSPWEAGIPFIPPS